MNRHSTPIETLTPAEVAQLLQAGRLLLVDVREPAEMRDRADAWGTVVAAVDF